MGLKNNLKGGRQKKVHNAITEKHQTLPVTPDMGMQIAQTV